MASEILKKAEETQAQNIEKNTGKKIAEWTEIIKGSGLSKHGELVSMLKEKYSLGHGNANLLVHYAKESHAGAAANEDDLITEQYKGKEALKTLYDILMERITALGSDVEISPKKAYVSLRRKKQFAIIQPSTKTRLDLGLNIKNIEAGGILEPAGSWNSMCSHRVKLETVAEINEEVFGRIKQAYEQAG